MAFFRHFTYWLPLLALSCQTKPYAPPPRPALVESVAVEVRDFQGRPEAHALVKGRLSSSVAQLVDVRQSRSDGVLVLEVLEQTPRGANPLPDAAEAPAFETRVPIELLGLDPGPQTLHVNGLATGFEIPSLRAVLASDSTDPQLAPNIALTDEFLPPGDAPPLPGGAAGASAY